jgi:hypothetical protein
MKTVVVPVYVFASGQKKNRENELGGAIRRRGGAMRKSSSAYTTINSDFPLFTTKIVAINLQHQCALRALGHGL